MHSSTLKVVIAYLEMLVIVRFQYKTRNSLGFCQVHVRFVMYIEANEGNY